MSIMLTYSSIMLQLCSYALVSYNARNYAGIIRQGLPGKWSGVIVNIVPPKSCPPGHYSLVNTVPLGE